jgi:peptidoglycan/xylan/chitin deacetylase (PgdA/CDA1 family)
VVPGYIGRYTFFGHLGLERAKTDPGAPPPLAWLPLSWDEVDEMHRHGITIGSHSMSHRSLGVLPGAEAESEARRSRDVLQERLATPVDLFAYPFGSQVYGDFDPGLEEMLRRTGYRGACTTVIGRCAPGLDRYALPRIPIAGDDTPFRVRCKLAGAYDWVGAIKTMAQRILARQDRVDAGPPAGGPFMRELRRS